MKDRETNSGREVYRKREKEKNKDELRTTIHDASYILLVGFECL